jgi:hypothetical protein
MDVVEVSRNEAHAQGSHTAVLNTSIWNWHSRICFRKPILNDGVLHRDFAAAGVRGAFLFRFSSDFGGSLQ